MAKLYVIAAPSGAGKTSLIKALLSLHNKKDIKLAISYTTRIKRANEKEGSDYFFINNDLFKSMIKKDLFIEYAEVFGNLYGTSREWIDNKIRTGTNIILELDYQGALQIKNIYPNSILIFILPPSFNDLKTRLQERDQDSQKVINKRLAVAKKEIKFANLFDVLLVNQNFDESLKILQSIILKNSKPNPKKNTFAQETLKLLMEEGSIID